MKVKQILFSHVFSDYTEEKWYLTDVIEAAAKWDNSCSQSVGILANRL